MMKYLLLQSEFDIMMNSRRTDPTIKLVFSGLTYTTVYLILDLEE
jgi:hypothetical protein